MDKNFISLLDAAESLAGNNDNEVEMWLSLLTTDAEEGRLPCIKSWTEGRDNFPGGFSFMRQPREWRVLRTTMKTWVEVRAIRQTFGQRDSTALGEPATATQCTPIISELPDAERRLALLRKLGGSSKYARGEWKFTGTGALVAQEKSESRRRSDAKTIRADLKEAAQAELDARSAGFATGLGQR